MVAYTAGLRESIFQAIKFSELDVAETLRLLISVFDNFDRLRL